MKKSFTDLVKDALEIEMTRILIITQNIDVINCIFNIIMNLQIKRVFVEFIVLFS